MKTDNFFRCFDFIVYALKAGKIHKFCYQNNYLRKALFELSEQGYICFCYTELLKHKFVILDKEIFNEVLTMKKFDIKDVFSWSNAEDAKQYIGKYCYFADSLRYLKTIVNEDEKYILKDVFNNEKDMVQGVFCDVDGDFWGLCLPADKVIKLEEEKKYRPFTLDEFNKVIPLGTVFKYRYKSQNGSDNRYVKSIYYHANLDCENGYQAIFFEDCCFNLGYCFEVMELFLNGKWQPFGVLEE